MKNVLKHIISFSMILILLVSTLQFSLYKMECLMSGNTTLSLTEFNDCNKIPKENRSVSKKCCDFNDITFNFDYDTNISVKTIGVFNSPVTIKRNYVVSNKTVPRIVNANFYTNLPPPSGYELLKVVQVFRI